MITEMEEPKTMSVLPYVLLRLFYSLNSCTGHLTNKKQSLGGKVDVRHLLGDHLKDRHFRIEASEAGPHQVRGERLVLGPVHPALGGSVLESVGLEGRKPAFAFLGRVQAVLGLGEQ